MEEYGQSNLDLILFALTLISSTPLMLPIWGYCLIGMALGYSVWRLALVMALGSALGSFVTYWLSRFFGRHPWIVRKFSNSLQRKWTEGKSRRMVAWLLFIGTATPIPFDVMYVACGVKRFPWPLFLLLTCCARFVR